jgi:hypothetical protein
MSDQLVARPLPKHYCVFLLSHVYVEALRRTDHSSEKSMPCVGFESTIPASEQAKTVHALDHSATVTGCFLYIVI